MPSKRASSAPTVVLVGRPNVGKSTLFNRITDSRRAIVTAIAGTTRDVNSLPAEWQGDDVPPRRYRRDVRRQRGSAARARRDAGPEGAAGSGCPCFRGGWTGRAGVRATRRLPASCGPCPRRSSSRSTRPTTSARGAGPSSSTSWDSTRSSSSRPSTATGSGICSTRSPHSCPHVVTSASRRRPRGNRRRHRRSAERREVLAAQQVAAGGAIHRQRDAGDDEGYRGRGAEVAASGSSGLSIPPGSGGRAGWRARGSSKSSRSSSRSGRSRRPTWRCW